MRRKPAWLNESLELPLFAAQAREDSLQDMDVVRSLGRPARVLVHAESSCTAAALATLTDVFEVHVVGDSQASLALARIKLHLLATRPPEARRSVLGHAVGVSRDQRREDLRTLLAELELPDDACGPLDRLARWGLDYAGRLERAWLELRGELSRHGAELTDLLHLNDLPQQAQRTGALTVLGKDLDAALKRVFRRDHAAALAGLPAQSPWAKQLAKALGCSLRGAFERVPAAGNPYLWQLLRGAPPGQAGAPWLTAPSPERMPQVSWSQGSLHEVLAAQGSGFDGLHVGDVLDRLDDDARAATLVAAAARLLPGGALVAHWLTGPAEPLAVEGLRWDTDYAERLAEQGRSPFTLGLRVARQVS